jgi:hypothetical protein
MGEEKNEHKCVRMDEENALACKDGRGEEWALFCKDG